jgi:tetratricopeptide (TPR) repeat protein
MKVDPDLVKSFVLGEAAIFIGAGLSYGAGLPTWETLIRPLEREIDGCPANLSLPDVAQFYETQHTRTALTRAVAASLRNEARPTEGHRILVKDLPVGIIYTTNFDELLERACEHWKRKYHTVTSKGGLPLAEPDTLQIIKLHGDFRNPENLVLTTDDFENYFSTHSMLAQKVASDLRSKTVLFVGYSFADPDMRAILNIWLREAAPFNRKHFITLIDPGKAVMQDLQRRGLTPVSIESNRDATGALASWLLSLSKGVEAEKVSTSLARPAPSGATNNLPRADPDLLGRSADVDNVREQILKHRIVAIAGPSGIGKTSVAISAAHEYADRAGPQKFEFIVWFTARNRLGQKIWLDYVLNLVGRTVQFPVISQRGRNDIAWKQDMVRTLLTRPTLLVLDNFEAMKDPALWKWLAQEVPKESRVLLTSTSPLPAALDGAHIVELKGLAPQDAMQLLHRYADDSGNAHTMPAIDEDARSRIVSATSGNPLAIKLSVGVVLGGNVTARELATRLRRLHNNVVGMFGELFTASWRVLSRDAESLMLASAIFVGIPSFSERALQQAAGQSDERFNEALAHLLRLGLIEPAEDGRYAIHPLTRAFAVAKLKNRRKFAAEARRRCAEYYRDFAQSCLSSDPPSIKYWNALVTEDMKALDREWPMLREQMQWAETNDHHLLIELVMRLIHYMDSRLYNLDRLRYVTLAADTLSKSKDVADEAILRIDGLGWTYVEENMLDEAYKQIDLGRALAQRLDERDGLPLIALANASEARIEAAQGLPDAGDRIAGALQSVGQCPSWIRMRIHMAAGDIAMKGGDFHTGLSHYERAVGDARQYRAGNEQYQLLPRKGLALIHLDRVDEACECFEALEGFDEMPLILVFRDYGLAFVKYKRGLIAESRRLARAALRELERRKTSNPFSQLFHELYERLGDAYDASASKRNRKQTRITSGSRRRTTALPSRR